MTDQKIQNRELAGYFSYAVGQCLSFGLVGSFILYFYTDILGISPAAAGAIFLVARIWDAINDPLIAGYMDTLNFKRGKFTPYMLCVPFLIAGVTSLSFIGLDLPMATKVAYAAVTYIAWGMIYTLSDVPFWTMSSVMSQEPQERAKAVTVAMLGVNIGIGGASIIFPKLTELFAATSSTKGYMEGALCLMLIALPLMVIGASQMKERVKPNPDDKITIRDSFRVLRANKPLAYVLGSFFCNVFFNLATGLYIFFFTYNMGNAGLLSVMGTIGVATSMACMLVPVLTKRFRKRDLFLMLTMLEIALRVGFYTAGYDNLILVFGFLALIHAANVITNPLISAMLSETIEYAELKSGRRCAAIAFSGQTFTGKLAWAIAGGISGTLLIWLGYQPNTAQTQATMDGLFICISLVPILGSIMRIIIMTRYNFTEDKHARVRHALIKWRSNNPI